jgi:TolB protein
VARVINLLRHRRIRAALTAAATVAVAPVLAAPASATFPGDNGKIAFATREQPNGTQGIGVVNPDGSGEVTLSSGHNDRFPAWSPDGRRIAFTRGSNVMVMNADGSNQVLLTAGGEPSWSPDGSRIAFESTRDDPLAPEIYSMNADGTDVVRLTTEPDVNDVFPAWSPDGTKIAFDSTRGQGNGGPNIWVMHADGTNPVQISDGGGPSASDEAPKWSPDGTKIAFTSSRDAVDGAHGSLGGADVFVMNAGGGLATRLTFSGIEDEFGTFSPDGTTSRSRPTAPPAPRPSSSSRRRAAGPPP